MTAEPATQPASAETERLLDLLLYSVSHDLRSPLLSISLSADLLEESAGSVSDGSGVALRALRDGAADLERMLQALTLLSRARRTRLEPARSQLQVVLGGHVVVSEEADVGRRVVLVDPLTVREMLDAVAPDGALELRVRCTERYVAIEFAAPDLLGGVAPIEALVGSLQHCAGTVVEALAVRQVLLERQGGRIGMAGERITLALPVETDGPG